MKTTFKIARTELYNLFYSPIAWLLLIIFLVQTGLSHTGMLENMLMRQNLSPYHSPGGMITNTLFAGQGGLYRVISINLYLYLPLLTMGLISREISSGTIRLLYSSPVGVRQIVLGKFLAMMIYNLLLMSIVCIFIVTSCITVPSADIGLILAGLIGVYLLLGAYSAIGLFLSGLTSYQVIAALGTLAVLALLNYISSWWQDYDFFRDITWYLSMNGRTSAMISGLLNTRDLAYFLVIMLMFLAFSICKLQGERETKPVLVKAGRYMGVIIASLMAIYLTSRPGYIGYWDTTAIKSNTIAPHVRDIVRDLGNDRLEITTYDNLIDKYAFLALPRNRNANLSLWEPYLRFKGDIDFKYVYYYDSVWPDMFRYYPGLDLKALAEKRAKAFEIGLDRFETPEQIHRQVDLWPEKDRLVMQLKYKGRSTFLRVFDDQNKWPDEPEVAAALKRLQLARLPKIGFLDGDGERSIQRIGDRMYSGIANEIGFRYSLINQGFDVQSIFLKEQDIPTDIATLVIADPRAPFDSIELNKIRDYVAGGGNLLVCGEPAHAPFLASVLQPLGVRFKPGMLVQQSKDFSPDLVLLSLMPPVDSIRHEMIDLRRDSSKVSMPNAGALVYEEGYGFQVRELLKTDSGNSWNRRQPLSEDLYTGMSAGGSRGTAGAGGGGVSMTISVAGFSTGSTGAAAIADGTGQNHQAKPFSDEIPFSAADGDEHGSFPTALSLTKRVNGKEQHIVVTGDADFLSNTELRRYTPKQVNFNFATNIFSWLSGGEFPIETPRPRPKDTHLNVTEAGLGMLRWLFEGILPGLFLVCGAILLIRRKRQ